MRRAMAMEVCFGDEEPGSVGRSWAIGCGVLTGMLLLVLLLYPIFHGVERSPAASCLTNLKLQSLALAQYAVDYDDRLPPSSGKEYAAIVADRNDRWQTVLRCPSDRSDELSYSFNVLLSRRPLDEVLRRNETVLLFEGNEWCAPALRHHGGSILAFADFHCKWYAKASIAGLVWTPRRPRP